MDEKELIYGALLAVEFMIGMWMLFPQMFEVPIWEMGKLRMWFPLLMAGMAYALNGISTPVSIGLVFIQPLLTAGLFRILNKENGWAVFVWQYLFEGTVFMLKLVVLMCEAYKYQISIIEINRGSRTWIEIGTEILLIFVLLYVQNLLRKKHISCIAIVKRYWLFLILTGVFSYQIMHYVMENSFDGVESHYLVLHLIAVMLLFFAVLTAFFSYISQQMREERNYIKAQYEMADNFYQEILAQDQKMAAIHHNIKYQRAYLIKELEEQHIEEALMYLKEKEQEAIKLRNGWTGFGGLDFIINRGGGVIEQNKIELKIRGGFDAMPIPESQMMVLFGNLFDNAIEAASKCAIGNRWIEIEMENRLDIFRLSIKNSNNGMPVIKNGMICTTKSDQVSHGWGLKSIDYIVKQYGGDLKYQYTDEYFKVVIMFWAKHDK